VVTKIILIIILIFIEMKIQFLLTLIVLILITLSCRNQNSNNNNNEQKEVIKNDELDFYMDSNNTSIIKLNTNAIKLIQKSNSKFIDKNEKDSLLRVALEMLNQIIKKDSSFYKAYINKSEILRQLNSYDEAANVLEELLKIKEYPEGIFGLGLIYEKLGNINTAEMFYKKAYVAYEARLQTPISTATDELNLQYVILFIDGKEKCLKSINEKLKEDPNNSNLRFSKEIIETFNRKDFIENY